MPVERLLEGEAAGRCAVVFLPGRFDSPRDFSRHGFAQAVADAGVPAAVLAADAHVGYYARRTVIERLRADVIAPLRAAGRDRVWLVGISMGGSGAILYARRQPEDLAGVMALAPFLGEPGLIAEIAAASGPAAWAASDAARPGEFPREIWRWLAEAVAQPTRRPLFFLAFGDEDSLAPGHRLLAAALPPERVLVRTGGHDWRTWRRLWEDFLATGALAEECRSEP